MNGDLRYLHKWLNEETTAPIDRIALARVLDLVREQHKVLECLSGKTAPVLTQQMRLNVMDWYKEMTK